MCLSLKCSVNSGWLPFIWSSLICRGLREEEESQVSTSRSDNTVCWSRQVRKILCENVVTFWSFISNWKQGQEDHEFILVLRIELLPYMQMRKGSMWKALWAGTLETALPFVIKANEQKVMLSDTTETVDCKDPALLACCQCALPHMTETLIKCQAKRRP